MSNHLVAVYRGKEELFSRVKLAGTFWLRLRGLMFYKTMPAIDGLLLYPCSSVHMFWMWFPLDLVYLDREGKVLWVEESLRPNQVGPGVKGAFYILEVAVGTVVKCRLKVGDVLRW